MGFNKKPSKVEFLNLCKSIKSIDNLRRTLGVSERTLYQLAKDFDLNITEIIKNKPIRRKISPKLLDRYSDNSLLVKDVLKEFHFPARTFYRKISKRKLRNPRRKTTLKLKNEIYNTYIQELSVLSTAKKLSLNRMRVTKILRKIGFKIPKYNTKYIKEHFYRERFIPIDPDLKKIILGLLLGDAHIDRPNKFENHPTELEYLSALNTYDKLEIFKKGQIKDLVTKYNEAVDIISKARTSSITLHKSFLEEIWIHSIASIFNRCNYPVTLTPQERSIHLKSISTANLCWVRQIWYPKRKKVIPSHLIEKISPISLLYWHIDDGTTNRNSVSLCTGSFSKKENIFLIKLLKENIGISKIHIIQERYSKSQNKYYSIRVYRTSDRKKYFEYLNEAPKKELELARELFPWKFDCDILKKDIYDPLNAHVNEDYFSQFLTFLKKVKLNPQEIEHRIQILFPWNS